MCVHVCVCVSVDPETAGGWRETQVFCTLRVCRWLFKAYSSVPLRDPLSCASDPILPSTIPRPVSVTHRTF